MLGRPLRSFLRSTALPRLASAGLTSGTFSNFLVEHRDNGVTVVSLNREEGKNSMSKAMISEVSVLSVFVNVLVSLHLLEPIH